MVYLRDIASRLDVSVSLVSKVLNDRLGTTAVSPAVIRNIRETAKEMGYRKNYSAAALREGRHHTIGIFLHRTGVTGSGLLEDLLDGALFEAHARQQKQLLNFFETAEDFRRLREFAHRGMIDGLIVGGIRHEELLDDLLEIRREDVPVVTMLDEPLHDELPNVSVDQFEVGRIATNHLIERGRKRIAHIRCQPRRFQGYRQAMTDAGLPLDDALVYDGGEQGFAYETAVEAYEHLRDHDVSFDGLFAQCDVHAVAIVNKLRSDGIAVPDQVSVIGCDNSPFCEINCVPISSVAQNFRDRGATAARLLMDLIDGKDVTSTAIPPVLHARASS